MDRLVAIVRPEAFLFENVPGLLHSRFLDYFADLMRRLTSPAPGLRYGTLAAVFNAADFGLPQSRRRLFITGLRGRGPSEVARIFDLIDTASTHRSHWRTVSEVLDPQAAGWMRWWYPKLPPDRTISDNADEND
jgi:site-specific DNA-cytosine methylase